MVLVVGGVVDGGISLQTVAVSLRMALCMDDTLAGTVSNGGLPVAARPSVSSCPIMPLYAPTSSK